MKFVDSNVFVYAFLRPKRTLTREEVRLKADAKSIVKRINDGEKVVTSVVHLAEVANILEDNLPTEECARIERALVMNENMDVLPVTRGDCLAAIGLAEETVAGMNDSLAHVIMNRERIAEIYSFDRDFDAFHDVKRVTD